MFANIQRANIGATTVIGSVPLRTITDSGDGGKGNQSVPSAGDSFRVASAISVLFVKLPANLKDHIAFRHFYTDELDAGAHALCIKYFSLFVLYFCTVFRLEGRRRLYLEQPTERSGREFAAAHKRAQVVFRELSTTYGTILMRYNRHSEIQYTARHAILVKGRTSGKSFTKGVKNANQQLLDESEKAFKFESEDFLFYENLSAFALQIIKLAFAEDSNMQSKALHQVNEMFRSKSYTFNPQRRRVAVRGLEQQLDNDSVSIKENTSQIAELLTPHDPRIVVKYANQQRTPFVQTRYPGGTSFIKYQRPLGMKGLKEGPTDVEKQFTVESELPTFPVDHPAMYRIRVWIARKREREAANRRRLQKIPTGLTPEPTTENTTIRSAPVDASLSAFTHSHNQQPAASASAQLTSNTGNNSKPPNGQPPTMGNATARPSNIAIGINYNTAVNGGGANNALASRNASGLMPPIGAARKASNPSGDSTPLFIPVPVRTPPAGAERPSALSTPHRTHHQHYQQQQQAGDPQYLHTNSTVGHQQQMSLPRLTSRNESLNTAKQSTTNGGGIGNSTTLLGGSSSNVGIGIASSSPFDAMGGQTNLAASHGGVGHAASSTLSNANAPWGTATVNFGNNNSNGDASMLGNTQSLTSPKSAKTEADRFELEEREAKFYEIFQLPRLYSSHAVGQGISLDADSREAVALAAAAHYQALAIAESSNTHHGALAAANNANASLTSSKMKSQSAFSTSAVVPNHGNINDFIPNRPLNQADYKAALATVIEAWSTFDLTQEIDAVYQAVANGVVVKDLSLPKDIMLRYDEQGILLVNDKDGTPKTVS